MRVHSDHDLSNVGDILAELDKQDAEIMLGSLLQDGVKITNDAAQADADDILPAHQAGFVGF
jgi:hypothetical protein